MAMTAARSSPVSSPLTASDIMTAAPRTCSPYSTITEATLIFRDADCGAIPVLDDGKPVGILTDRDVALALPGFPDLASRPVADVMTRDPASVPPDAPLGEIRDRFGAEQVRRLLVAGADGQLLGIIAWSDLLPHLPESEAGRVVKGVVDDQGGEGRASGAGADRPAGQAPGIARGEGRGASLDARAFWGLLKQAGRSWTEDKVPRLGAALSYYSALSMAPLLIIAIAVAGLVFGEEAARGHLLEQIRGTVGAEGAEAIQSMIANSRKPSAGALAATLGVIGLLAGAMGVVGQLQDAMNTIWEVAPKPGRGLLGVVKDRALALGMVLGVGFLLLASLVLSTVLAAVGSGLGGKVPFGGPALHLANFAVPLVVVTLLFAMIFKFLPDAKIAWGDVWIGAAMTGLLFTIGRSLLGLYLGRAGISSPFGAAGSLVVLLVWVYYSAQILYFGAEFTKAYANQFGTRIEPADDALPVTEDAKAQQGMPKSSKIQAGTGSHGKP